LLVIAVNALETLESVFYLITSAVVAYSRCDGERGVVHSEDSSVKGEIVCKSNVEDSEENLEIKEESGNE
jgi:hypothetical protein